MIRAFSQRVQSYADAIFAGFTRTGADGRKVVYPWGALGRGYVIATAQDEERLKTFFARYLVGVAIVMAAGFALGGYAGGLVAGALILIGYVIYAGRLTARMQPSGERLPLLEAYRAQACSHSPRRLWSWTITGIFVACLGVLFSVQAPENTARFAFLIAIGVFCAAFGGWMLLLRRGAQPSAPAAALPGKSVVAEEAAFYVTGDVGPVRAWFIALFGVAAAGLAIYLLVVDPVERATWAGMLLFGALLGAWGIAMLVLRHRENVPR